MAKMLARSAREYVVGLDLPQSTRGLEARAQAIQFSQGAEALAVGSELTEFTAEVPAELRGPISDSVLLAQLAANKSSTGAPDVFHWYGKYTEVLQNLGWTLGDAEMQTQAVSDENAAMHKAIIPVITAMLGPGAAAASIVLAVLNGLEKMDTSTPWITVFDRSSQHASGAKFQVSHVGCGADGQPAVRLLCLGIQAEETITQVLFFRFKSKKAELRKAQADLTISMERLNSAKDLVAARVAPFIADYVRRVEL